MKAGDIVVCVKVTHHNYGRDLCKYPVPDKTTTYTLRDIHVCPHMGNTLVRLEEIQNIITDMGEEFSFCIEDFRKMDHQSSSNSDAAEIAKEAQKYIQIEKTPERKLEPVLNQRL